MILFPSHRMHNSPLVMHTLSICVRGVWVWVYVCVCAFLMPCGVGRIKDRGAGANDTYPSAIGWVVVHNDIRLAILSSIPFDLAMIKTCIPRCVGTCFVSMEKEKKKRGKGRKGFRTYLHARHDDIVIWAMANLGDRIGPYKVNVMQHHVARI